MSLYFSIALTLTAAALILVILLQSREAGLGGLTGADTSGGSYHVRRGLERLLFNLTIVLSIVFFVLALAFAVFVG